MLDDERFSDIKLRGSDGKLVNGSRLHLSARSEVFQKMLLGNFVEATKPVVDLNYPGDVLRAIVEFIYTEDSSLFHREVDEDEGSADESKTYVETLVEFVEAAEYLSLPDILDKAANCSKSILEKEANFSCLFLNVCEKHAGSAVASVKNTVFSFVRLHPYVLLEDKKSLSAMSTTQLSEILQDPLLDADESDLFEILQN